jgi:hypothetical protein
MKFIFKMVFLLIPFAIATIIAAVVLAVYLLFNVSKVYKAAEQDDLIFLDN